MAAIRSVYLKPYWLTFAFVLLVSWVTRARDPAKNPCRIAPWGDFNSTRPMPEYVYEWCRGTEHEKINGLSKDMRTKTPPQADYSRAVDFGTNVRVGLWRPNAQGSLFPRAASREDIIMISPNVTSHSNQLMDCQHTVRGVVRTFKRWTWVDVVYDDDAFNLGVDRRVTEVGDACNVQFLCDKTI